MRALLPLLLAALAFSFSPNAALSGIAANSMITLPNTGTLAYGFDDGKMLEFGGMTYDHHRHRIILFGGGHATATYPSAVAEFDFGALSWNYLVNHVNCRTAYTIANALYCADSGLSGGFTYGGKIYAGSRHTYDGLEMAMDTALMICAQAQEFGGCNGIDTAAARYYYGMAGLFILDPSTGKWSVSRSSRLAKGYCFAAVNPREPDWIYIGSAYGGAMDAVNFKTEEVVRKASIPNLDAGSDMSMTYCPERHSFLAFPKSLVFEYDISRNAWTKKTPTGTIPSGYGVNVVYDTLNKVFCCIYNNRFHYYNPSENKWYNTGDSLPMARLFHHHIYDPVNNVHVMVGHPSNPVWQTYAYKFSDTAGAFPGTGTSAAEKESPAFQSGSLTLTVYPNPFRSSIRVVPTSPRTGLPLSLRIYDASGALCADLSRETMKSRTVTWNAGNRPSGLFAVELRGGDARIVKRLMFLK